jgi:hypothetical protein
MDPFYTSLFDQGDLSNSSNATVHYLIDEATCTWNNETIPDFFDVHVDAPILHIPINPFVCEDFCCTYFAHTYQSVCL